MSRWQCDRVVDHCTTISSTVHLEILIFSAGDLCMGQKMHTQTTIGSNWTGKKTERKETWIIFITCGSCFDQMENILIHAHLSTSRKSGSDSNSWPLLAFLCFPSLGAKLLDFLGQETSLCEPFTDSDDSHPKAMSVSSGAEAPTWPP